MVLTNGDVDAIAGLLSLREGTPFALYAPAAVLGLLDANPIFEVVDRDIVPRRPLSPGEWQPLHLEEGEQLHAETEDDAPDEDAEQDHAGESEPGAAQEMNEGVAQHMPAQALENPGLRNFGHVWLARRASEG